MKSGSLLAILVVHLGIVGSAGCAGPVLTRYYALADEAQVTERTAVTKPRYRIAIGPATVPEAVDRRQMVLHIGSGQYVISDASAWLTPLKDDIPRVVADEVARLLPSAQVAAYMQHSGQDAYFRVTIDVIRFESTPGESITLDVAWDVRDHSGSVLREASGSYVVPVDAAGIPAVVAAHRKALVAVAREIVHSLEKLNATD